jgi:hypothetical protein
VPPLTASYERALIARGIWNNEGVWYSSQKEHWLGWLSEYNSPGAYGRKKWAGRSAEFAYNHVGCPPMLMWLAEAVGVSRTRVIGAKRSALASQKNRASHCAILRREIPWSCIEERLWADHLLTEAALVMTQILHLNLHRRFFADIEAGDKRTEFRDRTPYCVNGWRGDITKSSSFGMGTLPKHLRCWWSIAVSAVSEPGARRVTPFVLVEFCGLGVGQNTRANYGE